MGTSLLAWQLVQPSCSRHQQCPLRIRAPIRRQLRPNQWESTARLNAGVGLYMITIGQGRVVKKHNTLSTYVTDSLCWTCRRVQLVAYVRQASQTLSSRYECTCKLWGMLRYWCYCLVWWSAVATWRQEEFLKSGQQLTIRPLRETDTGSAAVVLTRSFASSPGGIPITDVRCAGGSR